jgi:hypothetical protein
MILRTLFVMTLLSPIACSSGGGGTGSGAYAQKCQLACDPSAVMPCSGMDPSTCEHDCETITSGLTATCATCVTQSYAWTHGRDSRQSGVSSCQGYSFPSITDTSSTGCGNSCK